MHHFDNERRLKIGESLITVKLMSLVFFVIAIFVEIPDLIKYNRNFFKINVSAGNYRALIASVILVILFVVSIFFTKYYVIRFIEGKYNGKKQLFFDVIEIIGFLILDTALIAVSGWNNSPFKIIFFFVMISTAIQHGLKYGMLVSSVCSAIILAIDLIIVKEKPNPSLQIDLILVGAFLVITWLVGYYRSVEAQYSLRMSDLASRDDLTGLYSHGYFQNSLTDLLKQAIDELKPISLIFIDIDFFKYFNDLYGHQMGDEVLKQIGAKIEEHTKDQSVAARYGGEEFTIILYDSSEQQALNFAENLRKDIEASFLNKFKEINKITVSIGISTYPTNAKTRDELIKYADDALYRAKSFHRNRVEIYQSVLEDLKNDIEGDDIEIISSMKTLISIINSKDKYTYRHIERVVMYCGFIADALKLSEHDKKCLKYGAYLHDIGKIDIPQEILNKKMPLAHEEWEMLKQHPAYGVEIISPVKSLKEVIPIILHHHERYDGEGYPYHLSGKEIPYLARILTVADSFDAMTTNRIYSVGKSLDEGIEELEKFSYSQFDPEITQVFIEVLKSRKNIFFN